MEDGFLLLTAYIAVHLAGDPGLTRPWYVYGAGRVGIFREALLDTSKLRLRLAVLKRNGTRSKRDSIRDKRCWSLLLEPG